MRQLRRNLASSIRQVQECDGRIKRKCRGEINDKENSVRLKIERLKKEYPDAGCTLDYDQGVEAAGHVRLGVSSVQMQE